MKSPSASPGGKSQHSPGIGSIEIAPRSRWDVSTKCRCNRFLHVENVFRSKILRSPDIWELVI